MITQTINLNLIPGSPLPRINVSQYDNGSRTLQFNLYNGVSPYEIPSGASVSIVGTKADKTGFEYACTFDGSLVSVDITDQMTVFAGEVQSELQIRQSDEILGTANFIINVERAALSDDTQISETDIPIIQRIPEILEEAEGYADDAKHWAEQSETAVTGAVTYGYNGIMGAKNLLTFPYYEKTITRSGVTFTVNDDGTVTADGTATENCVFIIANYRNYDGNETALNKIVESSSGKFRLTGCPSGGSTDTYYLQIGGGAEGHITWWGGGSDTGNGRTFDANIDGNKFYIYICRIVIVSGCVCDNLVFKPMLRDANDVDETFRPYAMTNKELTDGLNNTHGNYYGTCATAAATAAKVVTVDKDFKLAVGTTVSVKFTNGVPANATMNINSKGAKPIYYHGSAITAGIIKAGDVATFIYNGSQYVLTGVDSLSTKVGNLETKMGTSDISAIGDGTVTGSITEINSDLSAIGTIVESTPLSTVVTRTWSAKRSLTIGAGTWLIYGYLLIASDDAGVREMNIANTSGDATVMATANAVIHGNNTSIEYSTILHTTSELTFYLNAAHDSSNSSELAINRADFIAVKLGN